MMIDAGIVKDDPEAIAAFLIDSGLVSVVSRHLFSGKSLTDIGRASTAPPSTPRPKPETASFTLELCPRQPSFSSNCLNCRLCSKSIGPRHHRR